MNAEEIRQRRRQKVLDRANAEAKRSEPQLVTQQDAGSRPKAVEPNPQTAQTNIASGSPTKQKPSLDERRQPVTSNDSPVEASSSSLRIKEHLYKAIRHKNHKSLLMKASKVLGFLLGLLSALGIQPALLNLFVFAAIQVVALLLLNRSTSNLGSSDSQSQTQTKPGQFKQLKTAIPLAQLLETVLKVLQYIKMVGSSLLAYTMGCFVQTQLANLMS